MTVKELYEWCVKNHCEEYSIEIVQELEWGYNIRKTGAIKEEMGNRAYSVDDEDCTVLL